MIVMKEGDKIMRKNIAVLAAGVAASMMIISGCSSKAAEETKAPAVTEASVEAGSSAAELGAKSEAAGEESLDEAAAGEESSEEMMTEIGIDVPIRIFGEIQEITEASMTVDNQAEVSSAGEMVLMIDPEHTLVLDASTGFPTSLEEVELGSFEAYIGPAMTMSLPPQTTASVVVVNIPEDAAAPQYVVAADVVMETADGLVLAGNDGIQYPILEEAVVEPFLTRNIVAIEDIHEGSRCLVWMNADGAVERLALMAE